MNVVDKPGFPVLYLDISLGAREVRPKKRTPFHWSLLNVMIPVRPRAPDAVILELICVIQFICSSCWHPLSESYLKTFLCPPCRLPNQKGLRTDICIFGYLSLCLHPSLQDPWGNIKPVVNYYQCSPASSVLLLKMWSKAPPGSH